MNNPDVLLVLFKRPDSTEKILQYLISQGIKNVYVSIDAPRHHNNDDFVGVSKVLEILDRYSNVVNFVVRKAPVNQGAGLGVYSAISWFFTHVPMGIIVEDDCLPGDGFLDYCSIALNKFKDCPEVAFISGGQFQSDLSCTSLYSTRIPITWGWATWRNRWEGFERDISCYGFWHRLKIIRMQEIGFIATIYFVLLFKLADQKKMDAWDVQWCFYNWMRSRFSLSPPVNLINYLGVDACATHTSKELHLGNMKSSKIDVFSIDYNSICRLNDLQMANAVHDVSNLTKIPRMFFSVCVPRKVFFWIRGFFR